MANPEPVLEPASTTIVAPLAPDSPVTPQTGGLSDPKFMEGLERAISAPPAEPPAPPAPAPPKPSPDGAPKPPPSKLGEGIRQLTGKPAPQAPAAPAAPSTVPADSVPEYKPGTKAEEWKAIHKAKDEALSRAIAAEERAAKARTEIEQTFKQQLDQFRAENEKLLSEIEKTNIERSPRFQKEFEQRSGALLSKLRTTIPTASLKTVEDLIRAPQSEARTAALEDIANGLSNQPIRQRAFADIVSNYDALTDERSFKIQQSLENYSTEQQTRQAQLQAEKQQTLQAFDQESNRWKQALASSDNPEFNRAVEEALVMAKRYFTEDLAAPEMTKVVHWAAVGPVFAQMSETLIGEIETLKAELAKFNGTVPDAAPNAGDGTPAAPSIRDQSKASGSIGEAVLQDMQKRGVIQGHFI